jgi:hypothetical protein
MRAFIASCAAAVAIAVVTAVIFSQIGVDTAEVYSSSNVRL